MAIGDDIKETYNEVGSPITIVSFLTAEETEEFCLYEKYTEQSTEFIRQHVTVVDVVFDTVLVPGCLVKLENNTYLVTSKDSTRVENEVAYFRSMLYKTNSTASIYKHSNNPGFDSNYKKLPEFELTQENIPVLFLDETRGTEAENTENVYYASDSKCVMYVQKYDVGVGDRVKVDEEFFLVENKHSTRLQGNFVLYLKRIKDDTTTY